MKKLVRLGFLFLMLFIISCSADSNDSTTVAGSLTATINGKAWKATTIGNVSLTRYATLNGQRFDIDARDATHIFQLACEGPLTVIEGMPVKSYLFDDNDPINNDALFFNSYIVGQNTYMEHWPRIGHLTITSINTTNKTISGTFNFISDKAGALQTQIITPDVFEVTNGVFTNLKYTVYNL